MTSTTYARVQSLASILLLLGTSNPTAGKSVSGLRGRALDTASATDATNTRPPQYTSSETQVISGFQPGPGYTYGMSFENIGFELISQLLQPVTASLDSSGSDNPSTDLAGDTALPFIIYDSEFVEAQQSSPSCSATCNGNADATFMGIIGMEHDEQGTTQSYNTKLLGDVASQDTIDTMVSYFTSGYPYVPANETQRQCIMDYTRWAGTDNYDASYSANVSTLQFAPGLTNDTCLIQMGSTGAYYNETSGTVNSLCNPDSPGKQFNTYLLNGGYSKLFSDCGYQWPDESELPSSIKPTGNPYLDFIRGGTYGSYGLLTAGVCQQNVSQSGLNYDACYCVSDNDSNGSDLDGLRCPMYGPIFYINLKVVWILGGEEYMKNMNGSRVPCLKSGMQNQCSGLCEQTQIQDFSECGEYY